MPRPKRPAHLKFTKESFSGPRYIVAAAKLAAGHPLKDFSPWVVAAIEAKLARENPTLIEDTKTELLNRLATHPEIAELIDSSSAVAKPSAPAGDAGAEGMGAVLAHLHQVSRMQKPKKTRARKAGGTAKKPVGRRRKS